MNEQEWVVVEAINAARVARGLPALLRHGALGDAARRHAADMATHPGMVHVGSDGSDGGRRMREAGYAWRQWAEVVGWGFEGDPARMVAWWLSSADHAPYLLAENVVDVGAGCVDAPGSQWRFYWTVDFGRTDAALPSPPPRPYTSHIPVVVGAPAPAPVGIDLLEYLCGDGRSYRVGNGWGSFEVFQTQTEGDRFYQVKAWGDLSVVNYEEFVVTDEHIGRDVDTSPGGGRFYRQFGAPWVRRVMRPGETFAARKRVQFYRIADCAPLAAYSGEVTDSIQFVERLAAWRSPLGVEVPDVVVLRWVEGGELYRYGRGWGLVGWERQHRDANSPEWSAISEMRPEVGRLERGRIECL